jgi:hypothetical protein
MIDEEEEDFKETVPSPGAGPRKPVIHSTGCARYEIFVLRSPPMKFMCIVPI